MGRVVEIRPDNKDRLDYAVVEDGDVIARFAIKGDADLFAADPGSKSSDRWVDPDSGKESCPECGGFGYHDDGSDEGRDCGTCSGKGVASVGDAERYIARRKHDAERWAEEDAGFVPCARCETEGCDPSLERRPGEGVICDECRDGEEAEAPVCTGATVDGKVQHDGPTCPMHEVDAGRRRS